MAEHQDPVNWEDHRARASPSEVHLIFNIPVWDKEKW